MSLKFNVTNSADGGASKFAREFLATGFFVSKRIQRLDSNPIILRLAVTKLLVHVNGYSFPLDKAVKPCPNVESKSLLDSSKE